MVYRCIDSGISDLVDLWIGSGSDNISGGDSVVAVALAKLAVRY
jgi:hypothetical protein